MENERLNMKIIQWPLLGLQMLFALSVAGGGGGCWNQLFLEKHPMTDPEFDFSRSLDFAVGDQFELLQDMYLYNNLEGYDDMGGTAEFWELNHKEPGNPLPLEYVVPEGEVVEIIIDRPLGSHHPKYTNMVYPVNYGYIKDIVAEDGEFQDAYVLGVDVPLKAFKGVVIAIIHRLNDVEDKLIVAPKRMKYSNQEIEEMVRFQEQYFEHVLIR